jgi:hypothetical protein
VNAYVAARNAGGADAAAKEGPAIDALNKGANLVSTSISATLSPQLRDALTNWVNAARDVANAISTHASIDVFNAAIDKLNAARSTAISLCDAAY